ncbi:MAG TPA: FAD:protein FMN transferase [bacterium]|nr:FAD:protein FMN transferase [bacterium]
MNLSKIITPILTVYLFFISCSSGGINQKTEYVMKEELLMDTLITVRIPESIQSEKIINLAFDEFRRIENKFSKSIEASVVYKINNRETDSVKIDKEEEFLLKESLKYYELTDSYFDISVYTIGQFWDFNLTDDSKVFDSLKLSEENFQYLGSSNIEIADGVIFFKNKFLKIDLGGIAKGYAIDRAIEILTKNKITSGVINAGGDVYAFGKKNENEEWNIAIQNPDKQDEYLKVLKLSNKSTATSGDYQRFVIFNGKSYCHIFNPKTGKNADYLRSVTVESASAMTADAIATAVMASESEYRNLIAGIFLKIQNISVFVKSKDKIEMEEFKN